MLRATRHQGASDAYVTRLGGAVDALRARTLAHRPPQDQRVFDEALAAAAATHESTTWTAAWAEGQAMTLEQVVAYALDAAVDLSQA
jgi:hypothetical protein